MTDRVSRDSELVPRLEAAIAGELEVSQVACSYGGLQAVRDVSLNISAGSFVGLIGPNGAGKSTLLDCISGVNSSYAGRVSLDAADISRRGLQYVASRGLGRTFQTARVFRRMTVMSNLMVAARNPKGERFGPALFGTWRHDEAAHLEKAWSILKFFDLVPVANNWGSELSGGQERLVELSRILMSEPKVLVLDEPFAGVSPANRAKLADRLRRLSVDLGVTCLMVEHRLEWVEDLCQTVFVMAEGRVIAHGTMTELRKERTVIESYLGASPISA